MIPLVSTEGPRLTLADVGLVGLKLTTKRREPFVLTANRVTNAASETSRRIIVSRNSARWNMQTCASPHRPKLKYVDVVCVGQLARPGMRLDAVHLESYRTRKIDSGLCVASGRPTQASGATPNGVQCAAVRSSESHING